MADFSEKFSESVRQLLQKHGEAGKSMTVRAASVRTGLSDSNISEMAHGKVPSRESVRRFADGLGEPRIPLLFSAGYLPTEEDRGKDEAAFGPHSQAIQYLGGLLDNSFEALMEESRDTVDSEQALRGMRLRLGAKELRAELEDRIGWVRPLGLRPFHEDPLHGCMPAGPDDRAEPGADLSLLEWLSAHVCPLIIEGDSLAPVIPSGTVVYVRWTPDARENDLVIARDPDGGVSLKQSGGGAGSEVIGVLEYAAMPVRDMKKLSGQ